MTIEEIKTGEKENVEYKIDVPSKSEKYMRTVVAYANSNGGQLVFGVENNTWEVIGFTKEEVFQKMDSITNAIFDSCEPKITPGVNLQEFEGRYIIIVDVPAGMQRSNVQFLRELHGIFLSHARSLKAVLMSR